MKYITDTLMTDSGPAQLAGDFIVLDEDEATGRSFLTFNDKGLGRRCGDCTLCCKLLPVRELEKPSGHRCTHQRSGKGCVIYKDRPFSCRTWSCRWMADPRAAGLPRPDRAHYVVDIALDHIMAVPHGGEPTKVSVIQVWVDPDFPDAHRDPKLRAYLLMMCNRFNVVALIRYDESRGFVLAPPPVSDTGDWLEMTSNLKVIVDSDTDRQEKEREMIAALQATSPADAPTSAEDFRPPELKAAGGSPAP